MIERSFSVRRMHQLTQGALAKWRDAPIDEQKLLRVVGQYRVVGQTAHDIVIVDGGRERHLVNLRASIGDVCDCGDHTFRESLCVHALAALLWLNDERIVAAVGKVMRDAWLDQAPTPPHAERWLNGVQLT